MGESGGIDSSGGRTMPKAYSADIRMRVIARVEGGASRREAAEQLDISPSAAVKWVKCFHETGSCAAKPRGGSTSPLEVHAPWLLALIEEQPDLTLDEVVSAMHKHGIVGSRTAVWSFFERHNISFKKKPARRGAGSPGGHVDAGSDGKPCLIPPDWCSSTRGQYENGPAERPVPARRATGWLRTAGTLENPYLRSRPAPESDDGAVRDRWLDEGEDVPRICRAISRSRAQTQRHRGHGQSSGTQSSGRTRSDRSQGRDASLSAPVLTGPESDRDAVQQTQGGPAQGR